MGEFTYRWERLEGRTELPADVQAFLLDMAEELDQLRRDVDGVDERIAGVEEGIDNQIDALRTELGEEINSVRDDMEG